MSSYELAWIIYAVGGLGLGIAAWLLFRRFGREWGHFFMVSCWVLLLTPYALDAEQMIMAPAIFILVMDGLTYGFESVRTIGALLLGLWILGLILSLLVQFVTRRRQPPAAPRHVYSKDLTADEVEAREELLDNEIPLRAER